MKLEHLERAFESIGARLRLEVSRPRWGNASWYAIDIGRDHRGQFFALRGDETTLSTLEYDLLNKQAADRHLLMLVKEPQARRKDRFLCGHDEREWFVAAIPGNATTVLQAKEALKPAFVRNAQARHGLNARQANSRHNAAFRRQGEWFFVPLETPLVVAPKLIRRWEPISRGSGSKPHLVEQIYRTGGDTVYVHERHPQGLLQEQFNALVQRHPEAKHWPWRVMRRNAGVYACGAVRHADHATIVLRDWHQVLMNEEHLAPSRSNLAFLD